MGLQDPGPPGVQAHDRRRDHDRPARPGPRLGRRLRDGVAPRARPARPRGRAGHEPVRPLRLRDRLRRRPAGGRHQRGLVDRRHAGARQPHRAVGRQPHLDRGRHRDRLHRGRRSRATRRTAGTCSSSTGPAGPTSTARTSTRCTPRSRPPRPSPTSPSFIGLRTLIAWPTPTKTNDHSSHGSKLGAEAIQGLKELLGFDPEKTFEVDPEVLAHTRGAVATAPPPAKAEWQAAFDAWRAANPEQGRAARPPRRAASCPTAGPTRCPCSPPARPSPPAPRPARCSARSRRVLPELWGGSADLAGSNNTTMKGEPSFIPAKRSTHEFAGDEYGRTLHFGIREHAHGRDPVGHPAARPDPALRRHVPHVHRLHARLGPPRVAHGRARRSTCGRTTPSASARTARRTSRSSTSPPLRAIPGLTVVRPADANETAAAWTAILEHTDRPRRASSSRARTSRRSRAARTASRRPRASPRARTCCSRRAPARRT